MSSKYYLTQHAISKMQFYGLSEQRIARVIRNPKRKEEGIVKNTIAVMQPVSEKIVDGKTVWKQEVWVMYQSKIKSSKSKAKSKDNKFANLLKPGQLKIISAWRYPGVSPKGNPIPEEIMRELADMI
ncbi:MAG: hypothetical protein HGB08_04395 [Candidatus Moranbacteria bacterium]|nr:hypothetical protein [Candidatus Moranbacteria bacterium]